MKWFQRLDVQLTLIFVAILSATVSLAGWIHKRGHLINLIGPFFEMHDHLQTIEPRLRAYETNVNPESVQALLRDLQHDDDANMYLVVNEDFLVIAHTAPENSLIELVRRESDPNYFVVETSSIDPKFDYILIYQMVPAITFRGIHGKTLSLLAIPKPRLIDAPSMRPILFDGLRYHFHIFGWFYGLVILFFVFFIRRRLRPLRMIEAASRKLTTREIPEPIAGKIRNDEVGQLVNAFNHALNQLDQQNRVRERMVADIAHELRTPLTNLSGRIEAFQDNIIHDADELIDFTATQVQRLIHIVEDLGLLSRLDAGELPMTLGTIDLKPNLEAILSEHNVGNRYRWQVNGDTQKTTFDLQRFHQIVANLIVNAIQAKPKDLEIVIHLLDEDQHTIIRFEDNGPGVSDRALPHLFDRLYRVDESRGAHTGGSGLGLSIVKMLVEAHNGRVRSYTVPTGGLGIEMAFPQENSQS